MTDRDALHADYATSAELMDLLRYAAESLSLEFDRWEEPYVSGPSLYFLVVADVDFGDYADPLGRNRWPVDRCRVLTEAPETFIEVARDVAFSQDGAVVVSADGTVQEQMVRVRSPNRVDIVEHDEVAYADWMGTKHLSAVEASTREEVLAAVTVSEENGRVSVFRNGGYEDYEREQLGGRWRPE
jgi:hypothetical protein